LLILVKKIRYFKISNIVLLTILNHPVFIAQNGIIYAIVPEHFKTTPFFK